MLKYVLIICPCNGVNSRIDTDLNFKFSLNAENYKKYKYLEEALSRYEIIYLDFINTTNKKWVFELIEDLEKFIDGCIYLDPNTLEGFFYEDLRLKEEQNVITIHDFINELKKRKIKCIPLKMGYDDFFREITIKYNWLEAINTIISI